MIVLGPGPGYEALHPGDPEFGRGSSMPPAPNAVVLARTISCTDVGSLPAPATHLSLQHQQTACTGAAIFFLCFIKPPTHLAGITKRLSVHPGFRVLRNRGSIAIRGRIGRITRLSPNDVFQQQSSPDSSTSTRQSGSAAAPLVGKHPVQR